MYPNIELDTLRNNLRVAEANVRLKHDALMRALSEVAQLKAVRAHYRHLVRRFCWGEIHIHPTHSDMIFTEMLRREPFFRESTDKLLTPKRLQELIKYVEENDKTILD